MPDLVNRAPDNPEFACVVALSRLVRSREFPFDISPTRGEAAALARLLDARSVRKMRFSGVLAPEDDGWTLEGTLGATVVQTCVVTLEPVTTRIDVPVRRRYLALEAEASEVEVGPEDDDEIEPLADRVDLGLVAIEALALALPPYPRRPDAPEAAFATAPDEAPDPDEAKPFASLAALRDKLGKQG